MAVRDYWDVRLPSNNKIIISPSVERNLIASNDNSDRVNRLKRKLSGVDIDVFQARYEERMRLQEILKQIFAETDYAGRMQTTKRCQYHVFRSGYYGIGVLLYKCKLKFESFM